MNSEKRRIAELAQQVHQLAELKDTFLRIRRENLRDELLSPLWKKEYSQLPRVIQELLIEEELRLRFSDKLGAYATAREVEQHVKGALVDPDRRTESLRYIFHLEDWGRGAFARNELPILMDRAIARLKQRKNRLQNKE